MTSPRVCIIGAGAIGLATAVFLAQRGVTRVTVLEAGHVASGSSGLSVGIVETQYLEPLDIELRTRAMQFFRELERDRGLDITRNGYLRLTHSDTGLASFHRSVEIQRELGVSDAQILDRAQIEALIPAMRCDDIAGGLFGPSDGYLDGHLYCGLLAEIAVEAGVEVRVRQPVVGASENGDGYTVSTESGEEVPCDYCVNAAGAWADRVAGMLGAEMPLLAQRHQATMVGYSADLGYLVPSVMDYMPHSGDIGLYFRHERPGQLVAGLHTEEATHGVVDPDSYARSPDHEFLEVVAEKLLHRLPELPQAGLGDGWAGIYPMSPDGKPQVGPALGAPRLINAGGAGGSGIQLSPVIGELVADWIILGEPRAVSDGARLRPGRPSLQGTDERA